MQIGLTGDWHLDGTKKQCKVVKSDVARMPKTLILMGDMIDTGIAGGMNWDQETITEQLRQFYDIVRNKKILGYIIGNHEYRVFKSTGLNIYDSVLGGETSGFKFSNGAYIVTEHGSRAPENQVKQVQDLADKFPTASLCALGHTHGLMIDRNYNKQWCVRTGHLQLYPRYAEDKIMKPKARGYIRYDTKKNKCFIEVFESYNNRNKGCYIEQKIKGARTNGKQSKSSSRTV